QRQIEMRGHGRRRRVAPGARSFRAAGDAGQPLAAVRLRRAFPDKLQAKLERAVDLAYQLANKKQFIDEFNKLVAAAAKGKARSYLDALNAITLNLAEGSSDKTVQQELKEAIEAKRQDSNYQIEGGFTVVATGNVYLREFAVKGWTERQLAGLISHEAT